MAELLLLHQSGTWRRSKLDTSRRHTTGLAGQNGVGTWTGAPDVESELSASSDEADAAAVAGAGTSAEPEASSDHDTPKEPEAPSSFVADPEGVPDSVRSSLDWEAVTTPDATVLGVALGARVAREGAKVPGGTYSRSRSSSEPMIKHADGATDFDRPRA